MRWCVLGAVAACLSAASIEAAAQQNGTAVIFLGELRSVLLTRPDYEAMSSPRDGRLIISNSCGEETATLRVIRSTSRIRRLQTVHYQIGEWCDAPIEFPHDYWLIIGGAESGGEPVEFPVFVSEQTAFAIVMDESRLHRLPEAIQQQLVFQPLPEPIEYPLAVDLDDAHQRQFISRQSSLEIRGDEVWVVRGILLASVFPGFSSADLRRTD